MQNTVLPLHYRCRTRLFRHFISNHQNLGHTARALSLSLCLIQQLSRENKGENRTSQLGVLGFLKMSQTGKLMPNLDQQSTKMLNLTVLQRIDPFIEEILITAAHVTFYEFNIESNQWVRYLLHRSYLNLISSLS